MKSGKQEHIKQSENETKTEHNRYNHYILLAQKK